MAGAGSSSAGEARPGRPGHPGGMERETTGWPGCPVIYEINTAVWLGELSRQAGRRVTLADVTSADWDAVTPDGIDAIWLMGVWERSPAGLALADANAELQSSFRDALRDLQPEDVIGSPYCVRQYVVDPALRRARGPGRRAGRAGCPRHPAAAGLRAQPRGAGPPVGHQQARAVRQRDRARHPGRAGLLAGGGRAHPGPRPRPLLPALARRGAAQRVLPGPARRGRAHAGQYRQPVRRDPL